MEVVEIISYLVNPKTDLLEVSFRLMGDSEDMIREDKIDYSVAEEYGYTLEDDESFDFFVYEDEDEGPKDYQYEYCRNYFDESNDIEI